ANTYVAEDFDEVVDAPIVAGNPTLHPFTVGEAEHFLVNLGGDGLWDGEKAAADVAKVVQEHQRMWGMIPYQRYFFLNVIAESGGGLEHDNSTVMLTSRWSFRSPKRYQSWLGLVSHEFFHTWNVRRLRPKVLVDYDYENENYFDELWVAEGVTSYYDDLALARCDITSVGEYLSALSKQINTLETTDGRFKQSLAESSHDAWIKFYRSNENSRNTTISYYNKGAIVGFFLDIEIRRATEDKKSLDDVMQVLYAKHALKDGYTTDDVIREVNDLTGKDYTEWFQKTIFSSGPLDYQPALDWLGLRFAHQPEPSKKPIREKGKEPDTTGTAAKAAAKPAPAKQGTWTGISTKSEDGKMIVSAVAESGPGFQAGINTDDEIIAVNDYRVSSSLTDLFEQFREDGKVELLIARRGALLRMPVEFASREVSNWRLVKIKEPSEQQKNSFDDWLLDLPEVSEQVTTEDSK
ncbi:MAG: PDZ domain-containing protein, partial [Planctomycetota bacterium]